MKTLLKIIPLLFAVLRLSIAMANEDITGTWQGNLVIGPDEQMTIQFVIRQTPYDAYTAVLNTPLEGNVNNLAANKVDYFAGNLKIDVTELSGSYDGDIKDGKIEGEWKQERRSFPLTLKRPTLSKENMEMLLGEWHGKPASAVPEDLPDKFVADTPTYLFRFEMTEQGEFKGSFSIPDTGFPDEPLSDMGVSDGILSFKLGEYQQFTGKLTDKEIVGMLKNTGGAESSTKSLTLVKGGFNAPVYSLDLPEEIKARLSGTWNGTLTMKIPTVVVFHFETSKNGDFLGFMDTLEEKSGYPVTDAYMSNGKLILYVKGLSWRFKGEISSDQFIIDWTNTVSDTPIIMNRGEYAAPEYILTLPERTMAQLEGKWNGKFGGLDSTFRFVKVENGEFKGFANIPMIGPKEISISDASLSDGKLTLKIENAVPVKFTGELSNDKLVGELKMPWGDLTPLSLGKEKTNIESDLSDKRQTPPWEKKSNENEIGEQ